MEQGNYRNKKFVLRKIAQIIKTNPLSIESALNHSKVFIENPYDKRELAEKVAHSLVNNLSFQKNIGLVLGANEAGVLDSLTPEDFSNLGGRGRVNAGQQVKDGVVKVVKGASGGKDPISAIVGAVVGLIDAGFSWATAGKRAKIQSEQYKQELIEQLYAEPKTNYLPIYIVGGVLLVGGVVTYFALKE
mgnify:CR=1 FL=1